MATTFTIRKSIFGRMLGISSSGGLVMGVASTGLGGPGSTDIALSAQMWGPELFQTIGAGATLTKISNSGVTVFSTASSAASLYSIDAPVKGVEKKIIYQSGGSTLITINTTATTILFFTSTAAAGNAGSSALVYTSSDSGHAAVHLVGASTLRWEVLSKFAVIT